MLHGVDELEHRPVADAVFDMGRDIGNVEHTERCVQFQATAEQQLVVSLRTFAIDRRCVTRRTTAGPEDAFAGARVRGVRREFVRRGCAG
jgi:hypothetical protein